MVIFYAFCIVISWTWRCWCHELDPPGPNWSLSTPPCWIEFQWSLAIEYAYMRMLITQKYLVILIRRIYIYCVSDDINSDSFQVFYLKRLFSDKLTCVCHLSINALQLLLSLSLFCSSIFTKISVFSLQWSTCGSPTLRETFQSGWGREVSLESPSIAALTLWVSSWMKTKLSIHCLLLLAVSKVVILSHQASKWVYRDLGNPYQFQNFVCILLRKVHTFCMWASKGTPAL